MFKPAVMILSKKDIYKQFDEYYAEYNVYVTRFCRGKLSDRLDDADDCAQDAFRVLFEEMKKSGDVNNVKAFLLITASNFINEKLKDLDLHRRHDTPLDEVKDTASYTPDFLNENISDEEILLAKDEILSSLSEKEFKLFNENNRSNKETYKTTREIAREYSISEDAARQRCFVLRQKVTKKIKDKSQKM